MTETEGLPMHGRRNIPDELKAIRNTGFSEIKRHSDYTGDMPKGRWPFNPGQSIPLETEAKAIAPDYEKQGKKVIIINAQRQREVSPLVLSLNEQEGIGDASFVDNVAYVIKEIRAGRKPDVIVLDVYSKLGEVQETLDLMKYRRLQKPSHKIAAACLELIMEQDPSQRVIVTASKPFYSLDEKDKDFFKKNGAGVVLNPGYTAETLADAIKSYDKKQ